MADPTPREPKKSDTLQIRIPHDTKKEFIEACEEDGTSASEVLRRSILDYLSFRKRPSSQPRKGLLVMIPTPIRKKRYLAAGAAGVLGLALAAALPSAADPNFRTAFQRLDVNGDGVLSSNEFSAMPFPDSMLYTEARINRAPGQPRDMMLILPGVRQDAVRPQQASAGPTGEQIVVVDRDFRRYDANGDAAVSYEEFGAGLVSMIQPMFDGMDRNRDGKLSREELATPIEVVAQSVHANGTPRPTGVDEFSLYDRNRDGSVSFEEYVPQP
jgi:hypothetical protein